MRPERGAAREVSFAELFDGLGTLALDYSAAAEALNGECIAIEGFLVRAHGPAPAWLLVDQPGLCPDCSPVPAAAISLPGAHAVPVSGDAPVRAEGRLDFGFRIDSGTASFLRLESVALMPAETLA